MTARHGAGSPVGVVFTPAELAARLVAELDPEAPVLDPACGDGALLAAAYEQAVARGRSPRQALERLHGFELLPELARRARERLAQAAGVPPAALAGRILTADALAPGRLWPAGTWVAANPPWAALAGRPSRRVAPAERRRLARGTPAGGWPSLQGAFLERIARHVADSNTGARVLIAAPLVELDRYGPLRAAVTRWVRPAGPPEELGEDAFPGVLAPAVLLTLAPRGAEPATGAEPWGPPPGAVLLEALARCPRLPPGVFADPGVHTGNAAGELIARAPGGGLPGVREGRCLAPYDLGPPRAYLRVDLEPGGERRFRLRPLGHYTAFPILLRQTADRPLAALHAEPTYFRNSLLAARATPGLDPAFLVAVLNGPLAAAWHRSRFRDARQRAFPQVKVSHLASLPLPIVHREQDPRLHDDLARRVRALDPRAAGFAGEVERLARDTLAAHGLPASLAERVRALAARRAHS